MGENKGLWLKVGQLLSLNDDSWKELEGISEGENIPPIEKEDFLPYLEALFKKEGFSLSREPEFPGIPASLSQVHRWYEKEDTNPWALKVQLPGMKEVISDQLQLLGIMGKAQSLAPEKKSFNTNDYHQTLKDNFQQELDYQQERQNIKALSPLMDRFNTAKVCQLHPNIQGESFITMSWERGDSWSYVLRHYDFKEKRRLATELVAQFFYQYFCLGRAQGDFHPGNFLFNRLNDSVSITWLDLGQCLNPSLMQRRALFLVIKELLNDGQSELGPYFKAWNFDLKKLAPISDRLPLLLSRICHPLLVNSPISLKDWHLKKDIDNILGEDKWWFRTAGSPELFMSIRCWIGLFSMLESLQVPVNYHQIWLEIEGEIEDQLPKVSLPEATLSQASFNDLAKKLSVRIYKEEKLSVSLDLPARAILELESFIKEDTLKEMKKSGVFLDKIIAQELQKGLKPGTIIDYRDGSKRYNVCLS